MRRHKQFHCDVKYANKSYNNLLPNDVADRLIDYMTRNKISIEDMASRLKMEERLVKKFWLRIKIPTEFQSKLIMSEVLNG